MNAIDDRQKFRAYYRYLNQGKVWLPSGKPAVQISDMDPSWRYNAARWMVRHAQAFAWRYGFGEICEIWEPFGREVLGIDEDGTDILGGLVMGGPSPGSMAEAALEDALDRDDIKRSIDPEGWLKTTPLYRALIDGLPDGIADLAKHWSDCPVRTGAEGDCTCRKHHVPECPKHDDINAECHCNDLSPEWTDD